ncbi:MAG: DNA ligase LigA-related protein [Halanaerobiales bacterium]
MSKEVKERIEILSRHIKHHNYKYYTLNEPEIPDEIYDKLFDELKSLEEEYPQYLKEDSPTQTVGTGIFKNSLEKVKHKTPMLSMDKAKTDEELRDWLKKMMKDYQGEMLELAYKADGLSLSLVYEKGVLKLAKTRGNGQVGENVTESALKINTIYKYIVPMIEEIRGEVVLPKSRFEAINEAREYNGEEPFSNCRNAASGILRNKELSPFVEDLAFYSFEGDLDITKYSLYPENIDAIIETCQKIEDNRDKLDFDIDGVIIRIADNELREEIGYTSHHPKWAIAKKFKSEGTTTILKDIEYQVSRTGRINPVAVIKPVELSGATINKATLHNFKFIEELNLDIGDEVLIIRAGEVIPKIIKNITKGLG